MLVFSSSIARKKKFTQLALIGDFPENSTIINVYHSQPVFQSVYSPTSLIIIRNFLYFLLLNWRQPFQQLQRAPLESLLWLNIFLFVHQTWCLPWINCLFIFLPIFIKLVIFYLFIETMYMDIIHFSFVYSLYIFPSFSLLFQLLYSVIPLFLSSQTCQCFFFLLPVMLERPLLIQHYFLKTLNFLMCLSFHIWISDLSEINLV